MKDGPQSRLLYHFCRLQLPAVALTPEAFERHLRRTLELVRSKNGTGVTLDVLLENLHAADWFLAVACLEGIAAAWEQLFAARTGRADCLLVDALRARAVRLYPRDEARQDGAVSEFWSHLLAGERPGTPPVLARYDGRRPLVPWLIRVFQNWHVSQLRQQAGVQPLPEDDLALPLPAAAEARWHEAFCLAARDWLHGVGEQELLILGLRPRYRMSQREVAGLLDVHEGTISRQTSQLRDRCLQFIEERLRAEGWTGDDLADLIRQEMGQLLLDEPKLAADRLAALLAARGKKPPGAATKAARKSGEQGPD